MKTPMNTTLALYLCNVLSRLRAERPTAEPVEAARGSSKNIQSSATRKHGSIVLMRNRGSVAPVNKKPKMTKKQEKKRTQQKNVPSWKRVVLDAIGQCVLREALRYAIEWLTT